ncbi:hypothetical protein PS2_003839 [Malus domestica]
MQPYRQKVKVLVKVNGADVAKLAVRRPTTRSRLPVAPMQRAVLLNRLRASYRLQTREQASQLGLELSRRKTSAIYINYPPNTLSPRRLLI